jgi:hypothetical protein
MRNWHPSLRVLAAWMAALLFLLLGSAGLRAEQEYEFGKALIDRNSPSFSTEDLVERLLAKLGAKPETQGDALMLKAYQCKRQARSGSAEKRQKLLDQVDGIYKEFTTKFPQHRLRTLAETEWASMGGERVKALLAAADETEKEGKAAEAAKLRNQAATVSGKIADQHKAAADAVYPKFVTAYAAYKKWMDVNGSKDPMPPIPGEILKPIDKNFDDWVVSDKRYMVAKAEQLDCYDANAPERKQLSAELAKLCQARAEGITDEKNPHPENDAIVNFPTLVSFYYFVQGRALAAVGTEDKATEAW